MLVTIVDVNPIIQKEDIEADSKIKKSWHWGNVGYLQKRTVFICKVLINNNMDMNGVVNITALYNDLKVYEEEIRCDSDDEDGYALATAHEILTSLNELTNPEDISNQEYKSVFGWLYNKIKLRSLMREYSKYR